MHLESSSLHLCNKVHKLSTHTHTRFSSLSEHVLFVILIAASFVHFPTNWLNSFILTREGKKCFCQSLHRISFAIQSKSDTDTDTRFVLFVRNVCIICTSFQVELSHSHQQSAQCKLHFNFQYILRISIIFCCCIEHTVLEIFGCRSAFDRLHN